ncbi:MAG TPA: ABC transporter ATP-binding protein [Candidatus Saccharimonadales bacterium]|nr:ABC transporter ATP-binding protein [Candidatus Saccharimonadales bacterium]
MSQDTVIKFKNVTKKYRLYSSDKKRFQAFLFGRRVSHATKVANDHLSFEIKRGQSVAILGRNGAGKSTMVKMVTGVVFPTSGKVQVNGRVSALLELTTGFDGAFSGRENIYLKGRLMGLDKQDIAKVEQDIIDFSEIDKDYIDQPIRTYSSGMKARLGFAINANIDPEILVVDEALSVGDMKFQEKCRKKVDEIVSKEHVTVLLVTHSLESAKAFCDRGLVMKNGKLIADAPIEKAVEAYQESLK